jgi:hypothetical protein
MLNEKIRAYVKSHKLRLCVITYFLASALLSLTVVIRLLISPLEPIKYANAILYLFFYYLLSCIASLSAFLVFFLSLDRIKRLSELKRILFTGIILCTVVLAQFLAIMLKVLPDYLALVLFIPVATALYLRYKFKPKRNLSLRKATVFLTVLITVCSIMPPLTAYICNFTVIENISSMSPSEKSSHISQLIAKTTFTPPSWVPPILTLYLRLSDNLQTYLISGVGACGEMATSTSNLINQTGITSRTVGFPGEDHAFLEVYLNDTWFVLDPGYYQGEVLTRTERAERRLTEMGAISYVVGSGDTSFTELTSYYIPTDNITLQILDDGNPVNNAQVSLEHTFMGQAWRLPTASQFFCTDKNGTVLIHLGNLSYNSNAGKVDNFFKIYVNGIDTGKTVSSTGNQAQFIDIDIAPK